MAEQKKTEAKTPLQRFDEELAAVNMRGQWQYEELLNKVIGGPPPAGVAHIWPWELLQEKLDKARDALPESFTARRNLSFFNPGLERGGTTQTILMGVQMVRPGEVAWAHRHSIAAIRFVIQGHPDLYTVVDGEKQPMEAYDLVLTPGWSWHDHHNESTGDAIWVDILDVPFVIGLNQTLLRTLWRGHPAAAPRPGRPHRRARRSPAPGVGKVGTGKHPLPLCLEGRVAPIAGPGRFRRLSR